MTDPFVKKTYYTMTLDPVHVGTGGYRLGRVDNTIIREPGTNLPKIPGSSISGATRAYTAMAIQNENFEIPKKTSEGWVVDYKKYKLWKYQLPDYAFLENGAKIKYLSEDKAIIKPNSDGPAIKKDKDGKDVYLSCAGKGADEGEGHCGEPDCGVCVPFGFSKKGNSFQGLAQFFDARILLFPVHSMIGPVWITSESILREHNISIKLTDWGKFKQLNASANHTKLNFGWLMLEEESNGSDSSELSKISTCLKGIPDNIMNRLFLVSDKVFSRIVNDNLEVRTSVAIDPATGAAEEGALFTYEAIPRSTIMWFDVVYNKPEYFRINGQELKKNNDSSADTEKDNGSSAGTDWIKSNVEKGLRYLESLGVGGMNTRGMGRLKVFMEGSDENS
ncbi:RAMP superfamily CRISPR-associated protein [uncultured Candidatus Kuenenia sp.]|uniref:RAMP superfamily CRISPR-associated protein n=1 Tax=uncultured Candidatus Kuenenia sp. TaxID=1048336 RepID=UPI0002E2715A|nr:RAMP superfamily CRISPR-associated protein [uncultured Candidatus Kuenenia sp.]